MQTWARRQEGMKTRCQWVITFVLIRQKVKARNWRLFFLEGKLAGPTFFGIWAATGSGFVLACLGSIYHFGGDSTARFSHVIFRRDRREHADIPVGHGNDLLQKSTCLIICRAKINSTNYYFRRRRLLFEFRPKLFLTKNRCHSLGVPCPIRVTPNLSDESWKLHEYFQVKKKTRNSNCHLPESDSTIFILGNEKSRRVRSTTKWASTRSTLTNTARSFRGQCWV